MKFFFLFGAIKFVLAEGGGAYGWEGLCKGRRGSSNNHTSCLGQKLVREKVLSE